MTPKIPETILEKQKILAAELNLPSESLKFGEALDRVYEEIAKAQKCCGRVTQSELPSHKFGKEQIQPLVPPLIFSLSKDE